MSESPLVSPEEDSRDRLKRMAPEDQPAAESAPIELDGDGQSGQAMEVSADGKSDGGSGQGARLSFDELEAGAQIYPAPDRSAAAAPVVHEPLFDPEASQEAAAPDEPDQP